MVSSHRALLFRLVAARWREWRKREGCLLGEAAQSRSLGHRTLSFRLQMHKHGEHAGLASKRVNADPASTAVRQCMSLPPRVCLADDVSCGLYLPTRSPRVCLGAVRGDALVVKYIRM